MAAAIVAMLDKATAMPVAHDSHTGTWMGIEAPFAMSAMIDGHAAASVNRADVTATIEVSAITTLCLNTRSLPGRVEIVCAAIRARLGTAARGMISRTGCVRCRTGVRRRTGMCRTACRSSVCCRSCMCRRARVCCRTSVSGRAGVRCRARCARVRRRTGVRCRARRARVRRCTGVRRRSRMAGTASGWFRRRFGRCRRLSGSCCRLTGRRRRVFFLRRRESRHGYK